ncbi:MAG: nuclear transport factor 2 family protein [Anaerolineales bacterium]|nr:nuclear transport factor 2 family protein [Chloroflexota bacterium]MBL6981395.1 nuclear transport factor 2 family protein [Anaerolineales bacterium]
MNKSKVIQEVLETEHRWVQAHRDLGIEIIKGIMHEDYTQIKSDGSVARRAETLASYASGARHWDYAESDQYEVKIYDNIALLIGRWIGRGENAGDKFDYEARFMSIYVRTSGGWKLIAEQSTPIEAPDL